MNGFDRMRICRMNELRIISDSVGLFVVWMMWLFYALHLRRVNK